MPLSYVCSDSLCADHVLRGLAEVIEHLRTRHRLSFIRRPDSLGLSDSHGNFWYCFDCETAIKDHRSFRSDKAMWDHLCDRHDYQVDNITPQV